MYYDNFEIIDHDTNKTFTFEITGNTIEHDYYVKVFDDTDTCIDSSCFSRLPNNEDIANAFGFEYFISKEWLLIYTISCSYNTVKWNQQKQFYQIIDTNTFFLKTGLNSPTYYFFNSLEDTQSFIKNNLESKYVNANFRPVQITKRTFPNENIILWHNLKNA